MNKMSQRKDGGVSKEELDAAAKNGKGKSKAEKRGNKGEESQSNEE